MKLILAIVLMFACGAPSLLSQSLASESDLRGQLLYGLSLATLQDSLAPTPKRRLLPENISFVERGIWGEQGILRTAGIASLLTPEVRRSELELRRGMLTAHQIGGFVTLGCMLTAVYCGQMTLDGNPAYRRSHETFVSATILSYTGTGLLALFSPPPSIRRDEVSTTTIHKALAWVHLAGMIVTPILGQSIKRDYDRAKFHQASAYITTAALAASLISITF